MPKIWEHKGKRYRASFHYVCLKSKDCKRINSLYKNPIDFLTDTEGLDYEFIDAGDGRKLERFGKHLLDRPEIEAKGPKLAPHLWEKADFFFWEERGKKGEWRANTSSDTKWAIDFHLKDNSFQFQLELSKFKHIGIFPEQVVNWKFLEKKITELKGGRFLNLFAYTSAASIIAAKTGAEVVNVEALKQLTNWSKENAELNGIKNIKWLVDDARTYVSRAVRREEKFQGILLDPPAFGYGNKGQRWVIEKHLPELLRGVKMLLDPKASFLIMNTYSPKMPMVDLAAILEKEFKSEQAFQFSKLGLKSTSSRKLYLGNLVRSTSI